MTTAYARSAAADDDATLALAAASGDRMAFAAIYDRYANRLYDFCVGMLRDRDAAADCVQDVFVTAASRLDQLREPDRLRSWLYAVARNEALSRIRDRRREQPSDELPEIVSGEPDPATLAARSELANLISDACGGLTDRDQLVLELSYRQGLSGPELADALGVSPRNANTLVERLRDTIARSLGALLICRQVRTDPSRCPELAAILADWDGQFTVLTRKRAARHIDGCAVCEEQRAKMVSPATLLGSAPLLIPAPEWLREATLAHAGNVLPTTPRSAAGPPQTGNSWWPPHDVDVSDLPPTSVEKPSATTNSRPGYLRRHAMAVTGVAAIVAAGGAVYLSMPQVFNVDPMSVTGHSTSSSPTFPSVPNTPFDAPLKTAPPSPTGPSGNPERTAPPGNPTGPIEPPPVETEPSTPPNNPAAPVVPPHHSGNPAGPVQPPSTAPGPVIPPPNSGGPVTPPGNSGGPTPPSGGDEGPVTPPKSGPVVDPGPPKGPVTPPKSSNGRVPAPSHLPPRQEGGSNSCTPPACIQPSGPLG